MENLSPPELHIETLPPKPNNNPLLFCIAAPKPPTIIPFRYGFVDGFCGFLLALYMTLRTAERMSPFRWDQCVLTALPEATGGCLGKGSKCPTPVSVCAQTSAFLSHHSAYCSSCAPHWCSFCPSVPRQGLGAWKFPSLELHSLLFFPEQVSCEAVLRQELTSSVVFTQWFKTGKGLHLAGSAQCRLVEVSYPWCPHPSLREQSLLSCWT